jgi:hypothetical protein
MRIFNIFQVLATLGRQDTDTNRSAGNDPLNGPDNDSGMDLGEDDENMVSSSKGMPVQGYAFGAHRINHNRDKHLRYRTRVFAAEYDLTYLSSLPFMFPCPIIYIFIFVKLFLLTTREKKKNKLAIMFYFFSIIPESNLEVLVIIAPFFIYFIYMIIIHILTEWYMSFWLQIET